jgi:undecaprenyl-diphosphatase
MCVTEAAILGVIQGITEWLPVSSSGHLALYQQIAGTDAPFLFDVLLHFASLIVIVLVFRKRIAEIFRERNVRYARNIIIGSLPIAVCGFLFRGLVEDAFTSMKTVSLALVVTGVLLSLTRLAREKYAEVRPLNSLVIGAAQAIALIPGISRSGATISTGMLTGINREKAAEFSFILAIPAIFGATIFELLRIESVERSLLVPFAVGMAVSFVSGYFSLKFLLKVIRRGRLFWFSVYCITLGLVLMHFGA